MKILILLFLGIGPLAASAQKNSADTTQDSVIKVTTSPPIDSTFINHLRIFWIQGSIANGFIPGVGYRYDLFGASISYFSANGSNEFENGASTSSFLCEGYIFIPLGTDKLSIYGSLGQGLENTGSRRTIGGFGLQMLVGKKYMIGIGSHTMRNFQVMIGIQLF